MVSRLQPSSIAFLTHVLKELVFERESSPDVLRQLPRQGSVDREVQKLLYHGRTGVLPAQDLLLERTETRLTRTLPCPHTSKEEGEELEQPRSALRRKWGERVRIDHRSVNSRSCAAGYPLPPDSLRSQCCISLLFLLLLNKNRRLRRWTCPIVVLCITRPAIASRQLL